ncbi:16S rRNA (cytosine(1402)-N(4))-methyltransferase RsmH [Hydromonas duriensis]|uniref:Ribosomal RNA small subunit methyltransferase H n=1 Tax=Hydromonas duriensis TaxID=1527608 RepID=A0A4R6Y5S1_9BURK|nr:16S rRNA (cytosine(1402)-N(4))-methyltransferase RsmH [Hydromonas duriensis]TDR30829.1 16S rRNA (cytosine1402-N4)-methyltransferase [Hydromonas duriensis]
MSDTPEHVTVMLHEAVDALNIRPDGVYVDGTFGRGGHSRLILSRLSERGRLWVFDKDLRAIAVAKELAARDARVHVVHDSFTSVSQYLQADGVDGVLLDLGVSSPQIDDAERGFSFRFDGPLDMRMDDSKGVSAAKWIAQVEESELAGVIKEYGEERYAKAIARAIVARRLVKPFERTLDLAQVVAAQIRGFEKGQHPATRTFQAIRIAVNRELDELDEVLEKALAVLKAQGRLSVISFHSLEDRRVKQFIARYAKHDKSLSRLPLREDQLPPLLLTALGKAKASVAEVEMNPRSRSAVLRIAEKNPLPI